MIKVTFNKSGNLITGFVIKGHSGFSESGSDIVCAAVSSCAYMTVNTITDVEHLDAHVTETDGLMKLSLSEKDAEKAKTILDGFYLHLKALSEQYNKYILLK